MPNLGTATVWDAKPAVDEAFRLAMKHRRKALGLSAAQLAPMCGFDSNSLICRTEKGEFGLQLASAWKIARGLDMTLDEMLELGEYLQNQEQARARRRSS